MSFVHLRVVFFYMEWGLTYNFDNWDRQKGGGGGGCLEVLRLCVFENTLIIAR